MCAIDEYIVLSESDNLQITYCKKCKAFSLAYKSCYSSFSVAELDQFGQIISGLQDIDFHDQLMDKTVAIVKNPFVAIGFCLTIEEAKELDMAIKESLALFEAFQVIYQ